MKGLGDEEVEEAYDQSVCSFEQDKIIQGKIVNIIGDSAIIDVGYKSEGAVPLDQFDNASELSVGDAVEVLLESVEDEDGLVALSKRKADRQRGWERVVATNKEGDEVTGKVIRKIKGGLLIEIGVPVFLPASQIGIRRTGDISEYIGQEMTCKIIKIDEARMNIVVSRRRLIEEQRETQKMELLDGIEVGQVRKGVVKNITEFGAFVDLGGLDGLLHITDMSWGRISHPSDLVKIDEEIEVKILKVDKEKERISLGLKQMEESPWSNIEEKYPVGSRVQGRVVNVLSYGAFIQLEPGVEGLVHISEMSWTKRINHPNQVVSIGDEADVVVLEIKKEKQEISLGMKQTEQNPWDLVAGKFPIGTVIEGIVRNLTNYGAFVELEDGIDGLLHVADMSWTKKVIHPNEIVQKGESVRAIVLNVDQDRKRIALGLKQLEEDPWDKEIPEKYRVEMLVDGTVTKITNFGVFVELEENLEGLLHISELADQKVGSAEEVVNTGDKVSVKIIRVDPEARKIGLSLKEVEGGGLIESASAVEGEGEEASAEGAEEPVAEEAEGEAPAAEESAEEPAAEEAEGEAPAAEESAEEPAAEEAEGEAPAAEESAEEPAAEEAEGEAPAEDAAGDDSAEQAEE
ncbi:MAG: 30S ribosomal protein S1 [Planctomycetota bacterium]|nr:30S ribosomal protein S1 [Planctomycetota bacterium]